MKSVIQAVAVVALATVTVSTSAWSQIEGKDWILDQQTEQRSRSVSVQNHENETEGPLSLSDVLEQYKLADDSVASCTFSYRYVSGHKGSGDHLYAVYSTAKETCEKDNLQAWLNEPKGTLQHVYVVLEKTSDKTLLALTITQARLWSDDKVEWTNDEKTKATIDVVQEDWVEFVEALVTQAKASGSTNARGTGSSATSTFGKPSGSSNLDDPDHYPKNR
ncbi:MAG: hypothetical protein R3A11_09320 [Bdellovibrionota bacterium]